MPRLPDSISFYLERRMARIFLLGIISGFPWVLIGSSLSLWLQEDGLSRSTIGWAGLIFGVYAFNFLWAPLIDRVRLPWLSARIGQRRAWILALQAVILVCLVLWSTTEPTGNLGAVIAIGLAIELTLGLTADLPTVALMSATLGITGQLGDLFESKLKRRANLDDSGTIFPGHGGILDRMDSLIWNLLILFHMVILLT